MSQTEAWTGVTTFPERAFVIAAGQRVRIDRVDCIIVSIGPDGITTRPVTDAD